MGQQLTLDEIKAIQYDILCKTADFCDQNSIRYFLTGGTLLGAVRHQGFIPWDDDIDIQMPRNDYKRFIGLIGNHLTEHYELATMENNPSHSRMFARIVDNRTVYKNRFYDDRYISSLGIDIFPMDGAPPCGKEWDSYFKMMRRWKRLFQLSQSKAFRSTNYVKAVFKTIAAIPAKLIGREYFYHKVLKLVEEYPYEESDMVGITTGVYLEKEIFPKKEYDQTEDIQFGNRKFHTVKARDKYLRQLYGDYMSLPPESERVRKHAFEVWLKEEWKGEL